MLADPEGNEFCVIEESNSWLAGTRFLGELAATARGRSASSGPRRSTGRWCTTRTARPRSSRRGGIRRSPGAGRRSTSAAARNRMHLVLVADDLDAEVERLVSLGASVVSRGDDVEMADPDGNEFHLRQG